MQCINRPTLINQEIASKKRAKLKWPFFYRTGIIFKVQRATSISHLVPKFQKDRASSFRDMTGHGHTDGYGRTDGQTEPNLTAPSGALAPIGG